MNKKLIVIIGVVVLTLGATTVAFAARMRCLDCEMGGGGGKMNLSNMPEVTAGAFGSVTVSNMNPLVAGGDLTGVGNPDVIISLKATAVVQGITCKNNGQQIVEAQPRTIFVEGLDILPSSDKRDKNGRTPFSVSNDGAEVGQLAPSLFCPNDNWNVTIDSLRWRGKAELKATQPDQTLILNYLCNQPDDLNQIYACTLQ